MTENKSWMCFLLACTALLIMSNCSYHKGETPVPANPSVSYQKDIKPILITHCYTCHTDTSTNPDRPGYAFFNHFDQLQHEALTHSVVNANYTILIARLKNIESPGMPYKKAPLADSLIQKIQDWVLIGAPEN